VEEGSRPSSLVNIGLGSTRTLVSGNPLTFCPPITVLIKNMTLVGNEWLEGHKNMSINIGPTPQTERGSETYKEGPPSGNPPSPKQL